jgi:gamma-glutamylputrescine oxidase
MTVSHWRRSASSVERLACDAIVIGAGVAGLSAALAFQRRGLKTVVVDRGAIGSGASTRNAGFLMRGAADHYADAIRLYGRDLARTIWAWTELNLVGLRAEGAGELPSAKRIPSALLALTPEQRDELRTAEKLLREDGFRVDWAERSIPGAAPDTCFGTGRVLGALINPDDGSINPVELLSLLAGKLAAGGTRVLEHREVFAVTPSGGGVEVRSAELALRAPRVLVCLNAYAPLLLPELDGLVTPRRGQMLALSGEGIRLDASYYANHGSEYFRQAADGSVVVGGCRTYFAEREVGYEDKTTAYVQDALEKFAAEMLGLAGPDAVRARLLARWAGTMGFSPDGLPLVGPVDDAKGTTTYGPNVWFCGGFTGHGMSMGFRTAHAAVEAMLDGTPTPLPLSRVRA